MVRSPAPRQQAAKKATNTTSVPLATGDGDREDELFTLSDTGKAIWDRLEGQRGLAGVVAALPPEYEEAEDGAESATCSASSPSSSRAACWSPLEPGQGRDADAPRRRAAT